uniref:Uncharacterized protein n=1 Tax=Heterorhabditis bacteriophora TaxID=37862 RepID=A0A1I7W5Z9_HETBA
MSTLLLQKFELLILPSTFTKAIS